jgi:hypothetical protein
MKARTRAQAVGISSALALSLVLTACGGHDDDTAAGDRHGTVALAGKKGAGPAKPAPRGSGSKLPYDFNGDGAPDLVLDQLAHKGLGDDPGIGIVYGRKGHGLDPATRQLLSPAKYAAPVKGQTPATFGAETSCDLDRDGYADLVVSTDPPYDGQGNPPVPVQILFGSPTGISGRGVSLRIPAKARFGNDWPDQPVCGDFDGDGKDDLVVHASAGGLTYLPGPFTRTGASRGTPRLVRAGVGTVPVGPAADVDGDGTDDVLVRDYSGFARSAVVYGGPDGPARVGTRYPKSASVAFGPFGTAVLTHRTGLTLYGRQGTPGRTVKVEGMVLATANRDDLVVFAGDDDPVRLLRGGTKLLPGSLGTGRVLAVADYDGDGHDDVVLQRTSTSAKGDTDKVTVLPGTAGAELVDRRPTLTFSTTEIR